MHGPFDYPIKAKLSYQLFEDEKALVETTNLEHLKDLASSMVATKYNVNQAKKYQTGMGACSLGYIKQSFTMGS